MLRLPSPGLVTVHPDAAPLDQLQISLDELRFELGAGTLTQLRDGIIQRVRHSVGSVARERLEHVDDGQYAASQRDLGALEPGRVAAAVPALVVSSYPLGDVAEALRGAKQVLAQPELTANEQELLHCQVVRLLQDVARYGHLADVVEKAGEVEILQLLPPEAHGRAQLPRVVGNPFAVGPGLIARLGVLRELHEGCQLGLFLLPQPAPEAVHCQPGSQRYGQVDQRMRVCAGERPYDSRSGQGRDGPAGRTGEERAHHHYEVTHLHQRPGTHAEVLEEGEGEQQQGAQQPAEHIPAAFRLPEHVACPLHLRAILPGGYRDCPTVLDPRAVHLNSNPILNAGSRFQASAAVDFSSLPAIVKKYAWSGTFAVLPCRRPDSQPLTSGPKVGAPPTSCPRVMANASTPTGTCRRSDDRTEAEH